MFISIIIIHKEIWNTVDCVLLARRRGGISLSPFQKKELLRSFLNNSELAEDTKTSLSERMGITRSQVQYFFQSQNKKPKNVSIEEYSKLLSGKGLKCIVESVLARTYWWCLYTI